MTPIRYVWTEPAIEPLEEVCRGFATRVLTDWKPVSHKIATFLEQIQTQAANQRSAVGLGRGTQTFLLESGENEVVDRVACPVS